MTSRRLVLSGVVANATVGSLFAWSLVSDQAARDLGVGSGTAAAVFALAVAVMAAALLATGRALTRTGPRPLLVVAAVAATAGLLLAATWHSPWGLWLGVAGLFGVANGVAYSVSTALAARMQERRRGAATGVVVAAYAGTPVALGVVGPPLVGAYGWRACTLVLGVAAGGLLLLAAALAPTATPGGRPPAPDGEAPPGTLPWLWLLFAGGTAPALMLFAHAVQLGSLRGLDASTAGLTVTVLAGGNLSGRLLAGWVSDRVGRWPSLAVAVAVPLLALPAVVWGGAAGLVGGLAVVGFCYGAVSALVPAATADLVGVAAFPRAYARVFSAWGVAGLIAPVTGAGLIARSGDTPAVLLLAGLPLVVAGVAVGRLSRRAHDQVRARA